MGILNTLFPNVAKQIELSDDNSKLEKKVKSLESTIESLREERKISERSHAEQLYMLRRDADRKETDATDSYEVLKRRKDVEVADANKRADKAESEAEATIERERTIATRVATEEAREEFIGEIDELKDVVNSETARAEAAEAESKQKEVVIKSLQTQMADYKEFIQFVLTRLPEVDLSSFNINVDVPPAEVTIVSGGNKDQGKKG